MAATIKQYDLISLLSAKILDNCKDVAFTEAREGVRFLGYIDMEAAGDDATVHVRFDFKCRYEKAVSRDGLRIEHVPSEVSEVEVISVRVIVDDCDVNELAFELKNGTDLHREWCRAMLDFVEPHAERLLEMI